jgi:hypothetical protein
MPGGMTDSLIQCDWLLIALAAIGFGTGLLSLGLYYRGRKQNALLVTALNNMSEGHCMFEAQARLILRNDRYIEMYGLPPELAKPGVLLRELIEHRVRAGAFSGLPDVLFAVFM